MIKLITFDLDDTLWDNGPVIRRAVREGYNWLLEQCPELAETHNIESLDQLKNDIKASTPELAHRVSEVRVVGMQQALMRVGYESHKAMELAREAFQVFHHWRHKVELFEGVEEMLAMLAAEHSLAVITNGNADVNALGLGRYFEFTVSSEDLNRSKPDPVVFHQALERIGIKAENALHVGDNLITDIEGAAAVGMKTIWFNPEKAPVGKVNFHPDATVHTLKDIPSAVQKLQASVL